MAHTPSTPTVTPPASATDPRYSTSGILNNQIKEKNRQGLLSTYGGRTGEAMDINKFANKKINMRDASVLPAMEQIARMYGNVVNKSKLAGVSNDGTSSKSTAARNVQSYNASVDDLNRVLASYGAKESEFVKGGGTYNFDKRTFHADNYGAVNNAQVANAAANIGANSEQFNDLEKKIKKTVQASAKKS